MPGPIETISKISTVIETIKDPLLVFLLCLFVLLGYVIYNLLKSLQNHLEYERSLLDELNKNSNTLAKLATLIEVLVHGRGGSN